MKRKKNNMWKKNFYTNISLLVCLVTVTALTAGCGSRKQDKEDSFDSIPERVESNVNFVETERNEGNINSAQTERTGDNTDSISIETEETEDNTDFNETKGEQDGAVFVSDQADSISVDITAENVIVVEVDTNLVLYQKNGTAQIAPASTAKIIMALTALDVCSAEDNVTVGAEIMMMPADSSRAYLNQGDTLTVRQLLTALLLPSGNDAAYSLAVYTGKKIDGDSSLSNERAVEVFMDAVNEKARELGAKNSNFVVPDGYDAEGQYTTPYDLAIIAKACLDNPDIAEIMAKEKSYEKWSGGREVTYRNTNKLLDGGSPFHYPEAIGIKTGTSSLSGASLVSAETDMQQKSPKYDCVIAPNDTFSFWQVAHWADRHEKYKDGLNLVEGNSIVSI